MTAVASKDLEPAWVGDRAVEFVCGECHERRHDTTYRSHRWGKKVGDTIVPICRACVRLRFYQYLRQIGYVPLEGP